MGANSEGKCPCHSHANRFRPRRSTTGSAPAQRSTTTSAGRARGRSVSMFITNTSTSATWASPSIMGAVRIRLPLTSGHGTTWEVTRTLGRVTISVWNDSWLGHGHDPASAPLGVLGLLVHDLLGEVPRQDEHIVGHGAHQLVDVDDGKLSPRHQPPLLHGAAV